MAKFTAKKHGELANKIVLYWQKQTQREIKANQWFMAALALGCALEAMLYAYFIIWTGEEDPTNDQEIPDRLVLDHLLQAAKQNDLFTTKKFKDRYGEHAVENVIDEIRHMRNHLHAGVSLRKNFDPDKFKKQDFKRLYDIFLVVLDNWERVL